MLTPPSSPNDKNGTPVWQVGTILTWSQRYLQDKGFASPRLDCELLLAKALDLSRIGLYTQYDRPISQDEQKCFGNYLRRRLQGEPIAYILGSKEFMGHVFSVGPGVLIPRPETELLVEAAIAELTRRQQSEASTDGRPMRVLDVGTGSGCIAIAIAAACPFVAVEAWDVSPEALAIACRNARDLQVGRRVSFQCVDALDPASWQACRGEFALVISNPPYIAEREFADLATDVRDFEPRQALHAEADGLEFYQCMAAQAQQALCPDGLMLWEIGHSQGAATTALLQGGEAAGWDEVGIARDYAGCERIVSARRKVHT